MKLSDKHKEFILNFCKKEGHDFISAELDELLSNNSTEYVNTVYRNIMFTLEREIAYKSQFDGFSTAEKELLELLTNSSQNEYLSYSDHLVNEFKNVLKGIEMMSTYELSSIFETGDFSITFPTHTIKAVSDNEAKEIAKSNEYGNICYDVKSREIFHAFDSPEPVFQDITTWIQNELAIVPNTHFEILKPRKNYDHKLLGGVPIMEEEDYEELPYLDWEKTLYTYCKENGIEQYYFEPISYGFKKIER